MATWGPIQLRLKGSRQVEFDGEASPAPGGGSMPGPVLVARVATTEEITLSGLQTIDGYDVQEGETVLVWQQSNGTNGVYAASAGDWTLVPGNDACRLVVTEEAGQTAATTLFVIQPPPEGTNDWSPIGSYDWTHRTPADDVQGELGAQVAFASITDAEITGTLKIFSAEPADAALLAGGVAPWFDPTDGAASINFKGKTLDGTVVSASFPMAP